MPGNSQQPSYGKKESSGGSPQGAKYAEKCPACHTKASPGSYRCPKCKVYFCVRCGKHLHRKDFQAYCRNSDCVYKDAPVCRQCISTETVVEEVEGDWRSFIRPIPRKQIQRERHTCIGCGKETLEPM